MSGREQKFDITTMLPLTNKELKPENTYCYSNIMRAGKYVAFHGAISTLLLPLTVQVLGGQYGELIHPKTESDPIESNINILSLTNMSVLDEVVLISLVFFAHLIGLISVIKKWGVGLIFYFLVRGGELCLSFTWFISVTNNSIKSHVMSQFELGWYCLFALVIEFISSVLVLAVTVQVLKCKKGE